MKRIIITGGNVFLGKRFIEFLLDKGVEVIAIVRSDNNIVLLKSKLLKVIVLDMNDIEKLPKLIGQSDVDVFYHFAWNGTSGDSREDYNIQINNIKLTCDAVKIAQKMGCKKFINAGSLMEYECMKIMESSALQPVGNYIYRSSKLAAHYIAKSEAGRIGISFINMIISNVYGEGGISKRFICSTLCNLIKNEENIFTSGLQNYDYIYITDAMRAFYEIGIKGKDYKDYYIGSGQIKPLKEYR